MSLALSRRDKMLGVSAAVIPCLLQTLPVLAPVSRQSGFSGRASAEPAGLTASCHWEMHCVRDSSNQLGTKERLAVLPMAFSRGRGVLLKVMGAMFLFLVAYGTTGFVLGYARAHTDRLRHTPWSLSCTGPGLLFAPLHPQGHPEEHRCDLKEDISLHTQEGRDLVIFLIKELRVKPIEITMRPLLSARYSLHHPFRHPWIVLADL